MAEQKGLYALAIVCIIAIVLIVVFVAGFVQTHPLTGSSGGNSVGNAYDVVTADGGQVHSSPGFYYAKEPATPTAYAYMVHR